MMHDIVLAVYYFEAIELNMLEGAIVSYCIKSPRFIPFTVVAKRSFLRIRKLIANCNDKNVIFKNISI